MLKCRSQTSKPREGSPSVGSNPTATAIHQAKRWSSHFAGDRCLCGWLHLSVPGGGHADVPLRPAPSDTRVANARGSHGRGAQQDDAVVGFAHAFANGVTVYLAISLDSLWRPSAAAGSSDASSWLRPSSGAALAA
jgi:hypothetical protein